jgi:hypothetical protein
MKPLLSGCHKCTPYIYGEKYNIQPCIVAVEQKTIPLITHSS